MHEKDDVMAALLVLFGILALVPVLYVLNAIWAGFIISKLWAWFAVPIFGLRPLGLAQCVGLLMLVGALTHQSIWNSEDKTKWYVKVASSFITSGVVLLVGSIVRHYI